MHNKAERLKKEKLRHPKQVTITEIGCRQDRC